MKVEIRKKWFGKYSLLLLAVIIFVSCQKKDIDRFDTATDYIYFDIPYQLNKYGEQTDYRLDSLSYSFALDNLDVKDTVINVYNPQNEMFATFQTKRYFIQNETSSKKIIFQSIQEAVKKHWKILFLPVLFSLNSVGYVS